MEQKLLTRNFALLILGQLSSLAGNFILKLAVSMYVLETTGSAAVFAAILSAATVPAVLLTPFGGIVADRVNKRNIMVGLDIFNGVSVLCTVVFFRGENALFVIGILLALLSVSGAFETPAVQACIPTMLFGDNILKGNAAVNQVAAVSALACPMLGSLLYTAFGVRPVMNACALCFLITALFESFIRLDGSQLTGIKQPVRAVVKQDFSESLHFIRREQPVILKMLLLAALSGAFVMGITMVGFPYLIRNVLGLGAAHYGAAESAMAVAAVLGSAAAGFLVGKLKLRSLSLLLAAPGVFALPAGLAFLLPAGTAVRYAVLIAAFCGMQAAVTVFSIFAVSMIQQRTPNHLIGTMMAYTSAVSLCAQPVGQILYGFLFDWCSGSLVLIPTAVVIVVIGWRSKGFFASLEI